MQRGAGALHSPEHVRERGRLPDAPHGVVEVVHEEQVAQLRVLPPRGVAAGPGAAFQLPEKLLRREAGTGGREGVVRKTRDKRDDGAGRARGEIVRCGVG